MSQRVPTTMSVDNQSTIALARNTAGQHTRTKHIDIRYDFIRQQTHITYRYIDTTSNVFDILTKPLDKVAHINHVRTLQLEGAC